MSPTKDKIDICFGDVKLSAPLHYHKMLLYRQGCKDIEEWIYCSSNCYSSCDFQSLLVTTFLTLFRSIDTFNIAYQLNLNEAYWASAWHSVYSCWNHGDHSSFSKSSNNGANQTWLPPVAKLTPEVETTKMTQSPIWSSIRSSKFRL